MLEDVATRAFVGALNRVYAALERPPLPGSLREAQRE